MKVRYFFLYKVSFPSTEKGFTGNLKALTSKADETGIRDVKGYKNLSVNLMFENAGKW